MVVQEWRRLLGAAATAASKARNEACAVKLRDAEVRNRHFGRRRHYLPELVDNHADQELAKFIWHGRLTAEQRQMLQDEAQAERNFLLPSEVDDALDATQAMEEDCASL
ncbi:hypothetical protein HDU90_002547 [Geranomyces variabilis]|nr:hypothetical protein HDU90_002547 [Geranomyces variabilis]